MIIYSENIEKEAIKDAAALICAAARTAPKARGIDNIVSAIVLDTEEIVAKMNEIGTKHKRESFIRDAKNVKNSELLVLIGAKTEPIDLKLCGWCGFKNCEETRAHQKTCCFSAINLGIAVGSAVSSALNLKIDNRIMYSAGYAAIELGVFGKEIKIAVGIPLSLSGKNIYFDRS